MNYIFSWAENSEGKLVHVDDVPRGLQCGCFCPNCHEQLLARHGAENEHGFAHHSKTRKATLKLCYMVVLYKLAEQILLTKKRIHAPSYYGIFKERDLEFIDVKIDNRYEREDKQPDVVATTSDGRQYLIEFVFKYKVQHKKAIDYKNMACLEVDLSNQTLESIENFLLFSSKNRKWVNNDVYFNRIEETYRQHGKRVKVIDVSTCCNCKIWDNCCAVGGSYYPLTIDNNGKEYRLCKTEQYEKELVLFKEKQEEKKRERIRLDQLFEESRRQREKQTIETKSVQEKQHFNEENIPETQNNITMKQSFPSIKESLVTEMNNGPKSCLECKSNLKWMNKNGGWAHCGCYMSMGLPQQRVNPLHANDCSNFKRSVK